MTNRKRKERQEKPVSRKAVTPVYNQILVQPVHRGINDDRHMEKCAQGG